MQPHAVVVMGVAGCGKSAVGELLAQRLDAPFVEGDHLHPKANKDKMARGEPLTDADREPWLMEVGVASGGEARANRIAVTACSTLKRRYRDIVMEHAGVAVTFLHLSARREIVRERLMNRGGHFMPASLLDSQFATLEPPGADEPAITLDASDQPPAALAETVCRWLMADPRQR